MTISVKRVYDAYEKKDGLRVLVDRLWPRGVTKVKAHIDVWAKELSPSTELRQWFHEEPERRYESFRTKYAKELKSEKHRAVELLKGEKNVTLVTAAKDIEHSHVPTLRSFLTSLAK
ncbi:MAG TPA: DUF488 family protein [Candidatus Paceibacterota bacterium]|nr:DUF488 family protein [Candidatus Paceibacterota bacterium]